MARSLLLQICLFFVYSRVEANVVAVVSNSVTVDCSTLRMGQYICPDPSINPIDPDTQQYIGCMKGKEIPSEGEAEGNVSVIYAPTTPLGRS